MPSERFETTEEFTWQPYRVKPLAVWAMRMNVDFECPSLQGTLRGKAGDWLIRADDGITYPVSDQVFKRYYVKREWRRPNESTSQENSAKKDEPQRGQGHEVHAEHVR